MSNNYQALIDELEQNKNIDMGNRWQPEELSIFLKYFRESQLQNLDQMQKELELNNFKRTIYNLVSVYVKNKNLLKFNKNIGGEELCAILEDYYDSLPQKQQIIVQEKTPQKLQSENNLDQYSEIQNQKNNQLLYSSNYQMNSDHKQSELNSNIQQSTNKKKRNYNKQKYQNQDATRQDPYNQLNNFLINREKKRGNPEDKGVNYNMIQNSSYVRINNIEQLMKNCNGKDLRKYQKKNLEGPTKAYLRWLEHEYYYSHIDKPYFEDNEFKQILSYINLQEITSLPKRSWYKIRKSMGKPRRFSQKFLDQEKQKLYKYRQIVRTYLQEPQKYKIENVLKNEFIVKQVKKLQPFQVGQQVMAIHPICGHFHIGQVLTTNGDCCIVKFNTNDLGVHKISENKISIELVQQKEQNINENQSSEQNIGVQNILNSSSISLPQNQGLQLFNSAKNPNSQLNKNLLNGQIFQKPLQTQVPQDSQMQQMYEMIKDIDLQGMAFLIKILDRKLMLINYLKEFNNYIEQNPNNITEQFTQDYGWTGVQINLLDEALKDIIIKFRLRGLQNYGNTQNVEQNMNKLMMGPLKQMQDQMKNSKTAQDQTLYQQIKQQNQRVFEESIQQSIQRLLQHVESDIIQEKNQMVDIEFQKQKQQASNLNNNELDKEYKIKDIENQKQQLNDQFNLQVDGINKQQKNNIENCDIDKVITEDKQINSPILIQNQISQKNDEPEIQIKQQQNEKQKDQQNNVQQSVNNCDKELDKQIEELESDQIKNSDSNIKKIRKNILKHVDWSEQEDTNIYDDLRDLIGNSMGVLYSLNSQQQQNNQFDISQNIYYKNMSQHIYSDFNQHYFKIQNTISNISSKTM